MKRAIEQLFDWWRDPSRPRPDVLASGFAYADESASWPGEEWLELVAQQSPWSEVSVVGLVADQDCGALFFEGRETVTLLYYRVAWWVRGSNSQISSLLALGCVDRLRSGTS